jgi:hypothetical protein
MKLEWSQQASGVQTAKYGPWSFKILDEARYLQTSLEIRVAALPGADAVLKRHAQSIADFIESLPA